MQDSLQMLSNLLALIINELAASFADVSNFLALYGC
jgi:hypothetical protein